MQFRNGYFRNDRFGNDGFLIKNTIDLIVVNEFEKKAQIIEVKRNVESINLDALSVKGGHFLNATGMLKDYQIQYLGLSLDDC